jgi:hypothetical protein
MKSTKTWMAGDRGERMTAHHEDIAMGDDGSEVMSERARMVSEMTISVDGETVTLVGPSAAIAAQVVELTHQINSIPIGSAKVDWAHGKASIRLAASFEPIWFEL